MSIATSPQIIYTVQPGDTLYSIASRFASNIQEIARSNYLFPPITDSYLIFPGQTLVVPTAAMSELSTFYFTAPGDTLFNIAQRFSTSIDLVAEVNHINNPNQILSEQLLQVPAFIYDIEVTDTLQDIASRFEISLDVLIAANMGRPGFSPDTMWPSYSLIIPLP
ncbi:LysM peptidoglycan-binding domain-containing protein [Oceanobacillus halophilus]|uniref:LysM peptidoglycan-binding domain-containing protein n=1 Tax=Oceanobacillus halophilus TaxID=930130 RepID=UPI0013142B0A|nr:LysM peptidoglycan-binding domain-containing protein [Oceanobacillus halophilus]